MNLKKFFDRVNHDVLMARVAGQVQDKTVLSLIRRFLEAGMMANGVETRRFEGTPQGGLLSPLLSNIYVSSQRAGQRFMEGIKRLVASRLKLTVNEAKSAVERPWKRKFLGYSVTAQRARKIRIAKERTQRLMHAVRTFCAEGRGRSLPQTIEKLNPVPGDG
jgi:RNA-directed DNA polymerase